MKEIDPEEFKSLVEQGKKIDELMEIYGLKENAVRTILRGLGLRIKRQQAPKYKLTKPGYSPSEYSKPIEPAHVPGIEDFARVTVEELKPKEFTLNETEEEEEAYVDSEEFEEWTEQDQKEYDEMNDRVDFVLQENRKNFEEHIKRLNSEFMKAIPDPIQEIIPEPEPNSDIEIPEEKEEEADYSRVSDEVYEEHKDDLDKIEDDLKNLFGSGHSDVENNSTGAANASNEESDNNSNNNSNDEPDISSHTWDF